MTIRRFRTHLLQGTLLFIRLFFRVVRPPGASALFSRDAWLVPLDSRPGWLAAQSGRELIFRRRSSRRAKIDLTLTLVPMPQLYESHLIPKFTTRPVENAQDVGAGDSFVAAMALTLAAGGTIEEAAQMGLDAAGIAVTKPRTAFVSQQELLQRVSVKTFTTILQAQQGEQERLVAVLEIERLQGKTIVFTNGVFDILHAGHIHFLRQAKQLGDVLVVAINSDHSTRRLKGPGRPIQSEQDRLALVSALDPVDYVLLFDEDTSSEMIRALRPHVYVKGGDYIEDAIPAAPAVREVGGRVVILPLVGSGETSKRIKHILATHEL